MGAQDTARRDRMGLETLVALADTLASSYDIVEFLQYLVDRCTLVLRADTAGVLLEASRTELQLVAATSEKMADIERAELSTGQGPSIEAYRTRAPVLAEDLLECRDRWPAVTPRLLDMGMRAGFGFPLQLRGDCIGALNIYRRAPGHMDDDDVRLAQALADVAAIGILQQRTITAAEERNAQLQHALDARVIVEQAKGVLAQRHGVDPQQAFEALRRYARDNQLRVRELSQQVVDGVADDIPVRS